MIQIQLFNENVTYRNRDTLFLLLIHLSLCTTTRQEEHFQYKIDLSQGQLQNLGNLQALKKADAISTVDFQSCSYQVLYCIIPQQTLRNTKTSPFYSNTHHIRKFICLSKNVSSSSTDLLLEGTSHRAENLRV